MAEGPILQYSSRAYYNYILLLVLKAVASMIPIEIQRGLYKLMKWRKKIKLPSEFTGQLAYEIFEIFILKFQFLDDDTCGTLISQGKFKVVPGKEHLML